MEQKAIRKKTPKVQSFLSALLALVLHCDFETSASYSFKSKVLWCVLVLLVGLTSSISSIFSQDGKNFSNALSHHSVGIEITFIIAFFYSWLLDNVLLFIFLW